MGFAKAKPPKGEPYFVGWIPRSFAEKLLHSDGEFLVRQSQQESGEPEMVLSLKHKDHFHHYFIYLERGLYHLEDVFKPDISSLIEYYMTTQKKIFGGRATLKIPFLRPFNFFAEHNVEIHKVIGEGAFGKVYYGALRTHEKLCECAIKVVNSEPFETADMKEIRTKFAKEAEIMLQLQHPNILSAYGLVVDTNPNQLILEYAPGGSLRKFLMETPAKFVSVRMLSGFCNEAASGLDYLASMKVIHGDIAARNCLLGNNNQLKICDFGLSTIGQKHFNFSAVTQTPTKWLAPEAFTRRQLSTQTDVWAFGVLMWEIFSRCKTMPYPALTNQETVQWVRYILK
ncbi:unnamed protein product [Enterobius vermicularis]|uniref:Tyrosine-protein kinase n=1 Tax=Enterobius vermicularis TaxID=51028 RepID=A0A0N4VJC6_ENTVE|nr:unnamed protein product [Enterobius vermicularis]